jgi:hypothetical protein
VIPYPQGEGCPDHPGPLQHWSDRAVSCWACDIRWVYEGSEAHDRWLERQWAYAEQLTLELAAA